MENQPTKIQAFLIDLKSCVNRKLMEIDRIEISKLKIHRENDAFFVERVITLLFFFQDF